MPAWFVVLVGAGLVGGLMFLLDRIVDLAFWLIRVVKGRS